jgi:hypothetical protein
MNQIDNILTFASTTESNGKYLNGSEAITKQIDMLPDIGKMRSVVLNAVMENRVDIRSARVVDLLKANIQAEADPKMIGDSAIQMIELSRQIRGDPKVAQQIQYQKN